MGARALAAGPADAPRIVRVKGLIDAGTDDSGKPQSCADYAAGTGYSLDSYLRDCFPQWDPTDGSTGNWNSAYDAVSLRGATHVWVDHNSFSDVPHPDSAVTLPRTSSPSCSSGKAACRCASIPGARNRAPLSSSSS